MIKLPAKTVERLSQYRRILQKYNILDESYLYSHDLASMLKLTAVQVRRDLMLLGISGNYRTGYNVNTLLECINNTLSTPKAQKATILGMGVLGQSLLKHISSNPSCPALVPVTFDVDVKNTGVSYHNIPCYDLTRAPELIDQYEIRIVILSIVTSDIQEIVDSLIISGIRGIINFSAGPIRVPDFVYLKDYDLRTTMDELSYFISQEKE